MMASTGTIKLDFTHIRHLTSTVNNSLIGGRQILIQLFHVYHEKYKGKEMKFVEIYTQKTLFFLP